ncbi:MAG TPA: GntR family transcriptional regulator [Anaerolineales bacterium]|nr:GntR family transcriptional regulator [Anaerolineales bacterium]
MTLIQTKSIAEQVEELLRGRIREGTYAPGIRMPSESELSKEFGVSRATIRTVLARLAVNGLILRKQGDGTYVNARVRDISTRTGSVWEFARIIEANGYKPRIETVSIEKIVAGEREADALAISQGTGLLSLSRLFYADDQPAILAMNVIPLSFVHEPIDQIDGRINIQEILRLYCSQSIAFAITNIRSTLISEEIGLSKDLNSPLIELQVCFYSKQNIPLALGLNYFNDEILRLSLVQAWNE